MKSLSLPLLTLLLAACASQAPAPVIDRSSQPVAKAAPVVPAAVAAPAAVPPVQPTPAVPQPGTPGTYTVKKGDTLYRIALDHGVYYRDLAAWNGLPDANSIKEGQVLRTAAPGNETTAVAVAVPVPVGAAVESRTVAAAGDSKREPKVNKEAYSDAAWEKIQKPSDAVAKTEAVAKPEAKTESKAAETSTWSWPAAGKITASFAEGGNKGIDIAGKEGDAINAATDGKVFFVGVQKSYGNLLIIGHANGYISVYAHNRKILVKEKDMVSKGQKVAEMGKTESESGVKLHFEIRQQGKPVDPLTYLPKR